MKDRVLMVTTNIDSSGAHDHRSLHYIARKRKAFTPKGAAAKFL